MRLSYAPPPYWFLSQSTILTLRFFVLGTAFSDNYRENSVINGQKKLSIDDQRYRNTEEKQPRIEEAVRMAMGAETPLQGELVLLQLLWKYVDDLSIGHVFDVEFLLAYHLKLQLLIRKELFSPMEGNAEFKRLFSNLQTNIKSI